MKRMLVVLMALMMSASAARADEVSETESLSKNRLWYVAGLPLYIITAGIFVHEGSHALATMLDSDFELIGFRPYPHRLDDRGWVGGSIEVRCKTLDERTFRCADRTGLGVIASAPYITDLALFTASDFLLSTGAVNPDSGAGLALYLFGMGASWYDFARNLIWAIEGSDPDQMARNFDIPLWSVVATASAVSAVGAWRLWVNGQRVFFDGNSTAKEAKFTITPAGGSDSFGVWAEVHF